jgi:hypothetical protein
MVGSGRLSLGVVPARHSFLPSDPHSLTFHLEEFKPGRVPRNGHSLPRSVSQKPLLKGKRTTPSDASHESSGTVMPC